MNNQNIVGNQWIAQCNPEASITTLLIPGTHDTMTSNCNDRYYRTQALSLVEQLQIGVRFLDIRLRKEMVAAHREWISDIQAEQIFETCGEFLYRNPTEFILMRIQNANENKDDFAEYGEALISKVLKYKNVFYQWNEVETDEQGNPYWPTIRQAAGRVMPLECSPPHMQLNKYNQKIWAVNWHSNQNILLQDLWDGPSLDDKCYAINKLINDSEQIKNNVLILNHISATNGELGFPDIYAQYLNGYTNQIWKQTKKSSIKGVQIYDFIDSTTCQNILKLNF